MEFTIQKTNQLKSIAILMMLFLHLFNKDYKNLFEPLLFIQSTPLSYYISLFCDACVPIFAFVSGYGLYYKFLNNNNSYFKDNLIRIKKLYYVFWILLFLFVVVIGSILKVEGYPGSILKFLGNFTAINVSYNGAWWFLTIYIFFVLTSSFWFVLLEKLNPFVAVFLFFLLYCIGFYFRIYYKANYSNSFLYWLHSQSALYFCTLFQFMLGAMALKYKWNSFIKNKFGKIVENTSLFFLITFLLIVIHSLVPNLFFAPFFAFVFIFSFNMVKVGKITNILFDFFTPHATNIWLVHMFFYTIYFKNFVYSFKYVLPIFLVLIGLSVLSSYGINYINNKLVSKYL